MPHASPAPTTLNTGSTTGQPASHSPANTACTTTAPSTPASTALCPSAHTRGSIHRRAPTAGTQNASTAWGRRQDNMTGSPGATSPAAGRRTTNHPTTPAIPAALGHTRPRTPSAPHAILRNATQGCTKHHAPPKQTPSAALAPMDQGAISSGQRNAPSSATQDSTTTTLQTNA